MDQYGFEKTTTLAQYKPLPRERVFAGPRVSWIGCHFAFPTAFTIAFMPAVTDAGRGTGQVSNQP